MKHLYSSYKLVCAVLLCSLSTFAVKANTYVVTNTNASGPGSFSQALFNASFVHIGADTINFNIPGTGPFVIQPGSTGFPTINDPLFINGYSQPGSAPGTFTSRHISIVLDATGLPTYLSGLFVYSSNVQIAGLNIRHFGESGIVINGGLTNVSIWGNFIGTDETGTLPEPNGRNGIRTAALTTTNSTNITIGTNGDGVQDAWEGNILSSNHDNGIALYMVRDSKIAGNYLGLGANGTEALGNSTAGIVLDHSSIHNIIGTNGDGVSDAWEANLVGNNAKYGVWLYNSSDSNTVAGNTIGLDLNNDPAPNNFGIIVWNSSYNRIGVTSTAAEANTICSSTKYGIKLQAGDYYAALGGATTQGNMISGNMIGTFGVGVADRGNGIFGVYAEAMSGYSVLNNIIGSNNDILRDQIEGNTIAFNKQSGVSTYMGFAAGGLIQGLTISRNQMYGNVELGIDLKTDLTVGRGVSANHLAPENGPNGYENAPVISRIIDNGDNFTIEGFSEAGATIEFFKADGKHPSNPLPLGFIKSFGEGRTFYLRVKEGGLLDVNDDNVGVGNYDKAIEGNNNPLTIINAQRFSFTVPKVRFPGLTTIVGLTATATDAQGNTSEYSGVVVPPADAPLPVDFISFKATLTNGKVNLNWQTENEINNDRFDVERSNDGLNYTKLGSVAASHSESGNYSFTDVSPLNVNYYRLKQVDIDGDFKYSKVVLVKLNSGELKISPNPFVDHLNVSYQLVNAGKVQVVIYDGIGRLVKRYELSGNKGYNFESISDLGNLPPGQYLIKLIGQDIQTQVKLVK